LPSAEFILWDPRAWNSPEQATAKLELVGRNPGYVFTEGQGCDDSQRGQGAAVRGWGRVCRPVWQFLCAGAAAEVV